MNKKILFGMLVIGLISALAGAGIYAYFSDTETSTDNMFKAGTLNLEIAGLPIDLDNMAPGVESDLQTITLTNVGSLPGVVSWKITNIVDADAPDDPVNVAADDFAKCVIMTYVWFDRDCDGTYAPFTGDVTSYGYIDPTTGEIKGPGETPGPDDVAVNVGTWWTEFSDEQRKDFIATAGWEGAPHPFGFDEWVLPDWIRWGSYLHGVKDGKLSIYEISLCGWTIDDAKDTSALDPNETYTHELMFVLDDTLYTGADVNDLQADGISVTVEFTLTQA